MHCLPVALRNLLANPFNCNCYLAWLGEWLRKKRIVTGNPRCQKPYFLKEIPIQDVAIQDFTCDDGKKSLSTLWLSGIRMPVRIRLCTNLQHSSAQQIMIVYLLLCCLGFVLVPGHLLSQTYLPHLSLLDVHFWMF